MKREDWLWLAIKVAGIYLMVCGVDHVPDLLLAIQKSPGLEEPTRLGPFLKAAVPLAIGLFLLLQGHKIITTLEAAPNAASTPEPVAPATFLRREDWLWVGMKLMGAWFACLCLLQTPWLTMQSHDGFGLGEAIFLLSLSAAMAISLWLLFGSQLWRWASRPRRL